jgi:predicted dehydrogenase
MSLRFGIVGCGGIAGTHAECLKQLNEDGLAHLVAGADIDPDHASKFSERWNVPVHSSLTELLKRDDIDVVSVTSPSGLHCDHAVEILESGRHALVEKPMDLRLEKVDAAIAAAKKHGVRLGGIFQQRFNYGVQKVKAAVDQGFFGDIVFVHCETPWYRSQDYYNSGPWRGTWNLDCGVLSNQAPHMIDRLLYLGGDVEEVLSATCETRFRDIEAETVAVATIRLKNGALGTITGTTLAFDGQAQRVLICGTEGSAGFVGDTLDYFKTKRPFEFDPQAVSVNNSADAKDGVSTASQPLALWSDMHRENIRDFIFAIQSGREPIVGGEDGRRLVRTLNLIYEKAGVGYYAKK